MTETLLDDWVFLVIMGPLLICQASITLASATSADRNMDSELQAFLNLLSLLTAENKTFVKQFRVNTGTCMPSC